MRVYVETALAGPCLGMASNVDIEGEYDFVEKPSEEFFCPVTYELLLDPVQANSCCGNHLSRAVANRLQAEGKPCPICQATPLKTMEDMFFKRKVRQLKVHCSNKSAGCEWVGELGELDSHLKPGSVEGPCNFVYVKCPLQCSQREIRRDLKRHKSSICAKRPFTCKYCNYESTYIDVVENHWLKCQRYPKVCPNNCSSNKIEWRFLKHHLQKECPLEMIPCQFAFAGCKTKTQRQSMKDHLDDSKDEHLEMTALECTNLKAELVDLKLVVGRIASKPLFSQPPDFIMDDFERLREDNEEWYSSSFYTHIGGYKMCLNVTADGWDTGEGTHVSVSVYMMKGEFDSHLKWPFKGEITVELVNQKEGGENYEKKPVQHTHSDDESFQRVTEGERSRKGWGIPKFISHSDLYKPEEDKEYLVYDTLIFRVTNVEVTSV